MSVVVLISGRGSNLRAIIETQPALGVAGVISNEPAAAGLELARARGVPTAVVDHRAHTGRDAFEAALARAIDTFDPTLVALAGFMRVLTAPFVERYRGRLVNIHPSLLPSFPGLATHRRALAAGVRIHGCTVHFVSPEVDAGPIIAQVAVPVAATDTEDSLAARVLAEEHRIYPQVLRWMLDGRVALEESGRVVVRGAGTATGALVCPPVDVP